MAADTESLAPSAGEAAPAVVLPLLAVTQFLMTVDTTVMNVSISALVEDLDTDVASVQGVITVYTLVMAAFMITGGKLGQIWGRKRGLGLTGILGGLVSSTAVTLAMSRLSRLHPTLQSGCVLAIVLACGTPGPLRQAWRRPKSAWSTSRSTSRSPGAERAI